MKSAVKLKGTPNNSNDKDEFWQVEVMLPFADLRINPRRKRAMSGVAIFTDLIAPKACPLNS